MFYHMQLVRQEFEPAAGDAVEFTVVERNGRPEAHKMLSLEDMPRPMTASQRRSKSTRRRQRQQQRRARNHEGATRMGRTEANWVAIVLRCMQGKPQRNASITRLDHRSTWALSRGRVERMSFIPSGSFCHLAKENPRDFFESMGK